MPRHVSTLLRNAGLYSCLCLSACALGEIGSVDQRLSVDRRDFAGSGSAGRVAYVAGPLQPNNCGTPDTFKRCVLAASRPDKPTVMVEELVGADAGSAAPTSDALFDYSRLRIRHLVLPDKGEPYSPPDEARGAVEGRRTE